MRTPDNETEGTESTDTQSADASALADGFAGADGPDGGGDESAFGSGWPSSESSGDDPYGSDEPSYLQQQGEASQAEGLDGGSELSPFEFEPDYVPDTDSDWDVTGDGVVDDHDFHEATTGFHDFHVDSDDSHGHAQNEGFFHTE